MKVAVIGNGPSYDTYDGWGDFVIGCKLGAPLSINYKFCACAHASVFDRILDDSWNGVFTTRMIYPVHMHYILRQWYTPAQQSKIISKLSIPYDSDLYSKLPKPFQPNLARLASRNLKGFDYNTKHKISTGHWAIIFAMALYDVNEIRCYGFDAHFDPTLKIQSISHSISASPEELERRKRRGWDYDQGAVRWNDTVNFLRELYQIPIQLVPPKQYKS